MTLLRNGDYLRYPREHVVLIDSEYGLTFIDNSRLWPGYPHTVLNVVASDFRTLSNLNPGEQLYAILDELHQYISFDSNTTSMAT